MRICQNHWIQIRDKQEAKYGLIAASMISATLFLNSEKIANEFKGDLMAMQQAVEHENGCTLCFYQKHIGQDPIETIEKEMLTIPGDKMKELQLADKLAREKSKKN